MSEEPSPEGHPEAPVDHDSAYASWLDRHTPNDSTLEQLRAESSRWNWRPLVSIVLPVYDPEDSWIEEAISSVQRQTYDNWELCIADDASTRTKIRGILQRAAGTDPRIKTTFRQQRGGISAASNSALGLATGELVALLDHDDYLAPHALHRMVEHFGRNPRVGLAHSDEDQLEPDGRRVEPYLKPDWSPELVLSFNYLCHLLVVRRDLLRKVGGFRSEYDGAQDYDLVLRISETGCDVGHVPEVLYTWRKSPGSIAAGGHAKPHAHQAARRAIADALSRRRIHGRATLGPYFALCHTRYDIEGSPSVAILIQAGDRVEQVSSCLESIQQVTAQNSVRVVLVQIEGREPDSQMALDLTSLGHRVLRYSAPITRASALNQAAAAVDADHLLFLDSNSRMTAPSSIAAMLEHSQRQEVGAVGCRLVHEDGRTLHEGVGLGLAGTVTCLDLGNYYGLKYAVRDVSAVTGGCMMIAHRAFDEVHGFDEDFHVAFEDIDLCMRLRDRGYRVVYTGLAEFATNQIPARCENDWLDDESRFVARHGTRKALHDPFVNAHIQSFNPLVLR